MKSSVLLGLICMLAISCGDTKKEKKEIESKVSEVPEKLKVLIVDGQNNH